MGHGENPSTHFCGNIFNVCWQGNICQYHGNLNQFCTLFFSSPAPSIDYSGNLKYPLRSLDNQVNPCVKPPIIPSNRNMLPPKPRSYEERRATTNYETMNNENVTNSRNYRENSSDVSPIRRNYRENSFDIAPARLGSVGPGGRSEEDNPRRQRSWRSQIRDQQLADNRRLLESVKRKCSPTPERERCYTTDKQFGPSSPQVKQTYTTDNQTNKNHRYNTREDNKKNDWMPVHELAINKHTKVRKFIKRSLQLEPLPFRNR